MQALNEKQQLYDMYQGNINPFKTPVPTQVSTAPPIQAYKMSDRDMLREMMRLKALYERKEQRHQKPPKTPKGGPKPTKTPEETPFEQERYFYTPPLPPSDVKPPVVTGISDWSTPRRPRTSTRSTIVDRARERFKRLMQEETKQK